MYCRSSGLNLNTFWVTFFAFIHFSFEENIFHVYQYCIFLHHTVHNISSIDRYFLLLCFFFLGIPIHLRSFPEGGPQVSRKHPICVGFSSHIRWQDCCCRVSTKVIYHKMSIKSLVVCVYRHATHQGPLFINQLDLTCHSWTA